MKKLILSLTALVTLATASFSHAQDAAKEVLITSDKIQLLYDVKAFTVKAGEKVKLTLAVPEGCPFPHNLIIVGPGQKEALAAAATTSMTSDPTYINHAVPTFEGILHHTSLVPGGTEETIEFEAPTEPGEYPYVCTYPGHWITMVGVMTVE